MQNSLPLTQPPARPSIAGLAKINKEKITWHSCVFEEYFPYNDIVILPIPCLQLASFAPVDLLFGGSPCNEISIANPARKGLEGMAYHIKYT